MQVLLTGSWNFKDIQILRQNRSKNKLVRENAVTRAHESCSLRVMGSGIGLDNFTLSSVFIRTYAIQGCQKIPSSWCTDETG